MQPANSKKISGPTSAVEEALRKNGVAEFDSSRRRRAEYSTDASNYRVVPEIVVFPRSADEILGAVDAARSTETPLTMRGAGTSVAGNAVGPGIVIDTSRYLNRVLELDPESRVARVEPGTVVATIQKQSMPHGLRFGPDPSTWARCTIGGMIGNNACGPRALAYGKTADNVLELDAVDGTGRRFMSSKGFQTIPELERLVHDNLAIIRTELGRFDRQISGYSLEHLLPENGKNLTRALVGTEGSCVAILEATVRLVDIPRDPALLVLGYSDMPSAADAVPSILGHGATAIEGLDARIVQALRSRIGENAVPDLPPGSGWLLVEVPEQLAGDALHRAQMIADLSGTDSVRILPPGPEAQAIWKIREDGAGLAGRTQSNRQAWPGIEDAAVPPENLGAYLREFDSLTNSYGLEGMPYGHFGDGCVHVRLDIPLETDGSVLRSFMMDAAKLIASYGGSLAGEHGDGRARSELLEYMYTPEMRDLFSAFKQVFDPQDIFNPGVVVRPAPLDRDLRRPAALPISRVNGFAFEHDGGDITSAVHRCVGVGKCRANNSASGGFMCPSYQATQDEKDSTRGRSRVLQEMLNGSFVTGGWDAPELHDALDFCLSCKACSRDCPAGVDMAALKSEALHRKHEGKIRPISHYTLGWMPRWARLATRMSAVANAALSSRSIEKLVLYAGGMDTRRSVPRFAKKSFRAWWKKRPVTPERARSVVLWADTFTDNFSPSIARATVDILESVGYHVIVPAQTVCCGLTWISTGQLEGARHKMTDLVSKFSGYAEAGIPVLGLEPSCTAAVRSDLLELLPGNETAQAVSKNIFTLSELLASAEPVGPGTQWHRPDLSGTKLLVQPHCHQHSVMSFRPDEELLISLGAELKILSGCCGLAGNFGMERGHYDISVAVAENALLPALREKPEDTIFLADGLSCRTQAEQLAGVRGVHLAELLAEHLPEVTILH